MRKQGLAGVSTARQIAACFLMGAIVPIGLLLVFGAPGHLVWAWESPKYLYGEWTLVLYARSKVERITPAKLREELERTEAWLRAAEHRPVSRPATATSSPN